MYFSRKCVNILELARVAQLVEHVADTDGVPGSNPGARIMKAQIILIVGPAGAGKSTISNFLSRRFERSTVIPVDAIRDMVRMGNVRPFPKTTEGDAQLILSVENACALANNFIRMGFTVIIDDVVSSKDRLDLYFKLLVEEPHPFLLLPNREVVIERDLSRAAENQMKERAIELHDKFVERIKEETRWQVIDSSKLSPDETVGQIIELLR